MLATNTLARAFEALSSVQAKSFKVLLFGYRVIAYDEVDAGAETLNGIEYILEALSQRHKGRFERA